MGIQKLKERTVFVQKKRVRELIPQKSVFDQEETKRAAAEANKVESKKIAEQLE